MGDWCWLGILMIPVPRRTEKVDALHPFRHARTEAVFHLLRLVPPPSQNRARQGTVLPHGMHAFSTPYWHIL